MTLVPETNVITLQSHRRWNAARLRERELSEAMRRHPSSLPKRAAGAASSGTDASA